VRKVEYCTCIICDHISTKVYKNIDKGLVGNICVQLYLTWVKEIHVCDPDLKNY
jgi:hypothetical protein